MDQAQITDYRQLASEVREYGLPHIAVAIEALLARVIELQSRLV